MARIYEELVKAITDRIDVEPEKITPTATLGDLEVDSLLEVEIAEALQISLGVPVDDRRFVSRSTLQELKEYLTQQAAR